jgi:heme A synthase
VRASGSGAGCGSHWPLCNGEVVPRAPAVATLIELTHRGTSGLALVAVVALLVGAFRRFDRGHPVRAAALAATALILVEAAVGAGLVLFELVAGNASLARALFMAVHLMTTFLLLAALALTAHWAGGGRRPFPPGSGDGAAAWPLAVGLLGVLAVGVSGAVAALGDTLYPAPSLGAGIAQDLSPAAHLLVRLRVLHPLIAVLVGLYLIFLGRRPGGREPSPRASLLGNRLTLLVLAQLGAGTLNLALLAPIWLQLVHLLLADLIWIALVLLLAERLAARQPADRVAAPSLAGSRA